MKKYLVNTIYLFLFSLTQCSGQNQIAKKKSGNSSFKLVLREYRIDSCLTNILYSIVELDSSHVRYPPNLYCYSILFTKSNSYRTIIITPKRWVSDLPKDCSGIIEIGNMSFLCCGEFERSALFIDMGSELEKNVYLNETVMYDSLDAKSNLLDWKNSPTALVGSYKLCQGSPIDLYINVGKKLEGFSTK